MKKNLNTFIFSALLSSFALLVSAGNFYGQEEPVEELEVFEIEEEVIDPVGLLPKVPVDSVFGFGENLVDIPRSVSSISAEMLQQFGITDINGLVAFSPGAFTTSFFGVAGQLDLRGAPGETYFRGMKRIENPGNYQTPIGASDRVDVVRGPATPIYGAGKIGGYLNFIPKSARAATGKYFDKPRGQFSFTYGSYSKKYATAEVGGPISLGDKAGGYYVYFLVEDSGSYYNNTYIEQTIVQSTFTIDLNEKWRVELGEQYQNFNSTENAGWNRVTQALVDDGTYTAGTPLINPDDPANGGDGDGQLDRIEAFNVQPGNFPLSYFLSSGLGFPLEVPGFGSVPPTGIGGLNEVLALDPDTVFMTKIEGSQVLIDEKDFLVSDSFVFFMDFINDSNPDFTIKNKIFADWLIRNKRASYGFSQINNVFSIENKLIIEGNSGRRDGFHVNWQLSPSVRWYDADDGGDFRVETFDRRDLSFNGGTGRPTDRRAHSLDDSSKNSWGNRYQSEMLEIAGSIMANITIKERLNFLLGGRISDYDIDSFERPGTLAANNLLGLNDDCCVGGPTGVPTSSHKAVWAYTLSASYKTPWGFRPYVTNARQPILTTGQSGGVPASGNIGGDPLANTDLWEGGFKGKALDGKLFYSFAIYQQNLASYNSQTLTITATRGTGYEAELRYVPNANLSFSFAGNWQKTVYRPLVGSNSCFQFINPEQATFLTGIPADGADVWGGTFSSSDSCRPDLLADHDERPGVPDKTLSFNTTYRNNGGWGVNVGFSYIADVHADRLKQLKLPDAFVINGALYYGTERWEIKFTGKNLLDERYFRGNFPGLFGGVTVLPQLPITSEVTFTYKF